MEDYNNQYGILVRILMKNTNAGVTTKRTEIKEKLSIDIKDLHKLILYAKENVRTLGLELIGIEKGKIIDPIDSEKYYLRKTGEIKTIMKEEKFNVVFKKNISIFTLLCLENNVMSMQRISYLCKKIIFFKNEDIEGYLNIYKDEDEVFVTLGWRFYVEYDVSAMLDFLNNL